MSVVVIAFLMALGGGGWIYTYFMRTSGSNTGRSLVAAAVSGILIFIFLIAALNFGFSFLNGS